MDTEMTYCWIATASNVGEFHLAVKAKSLDEARKEVITYIEEKSEAIEKMYLDDRYLFQINYGSPYMDEQLHKLNQAKVQTSRIKLTIPGKFYHYTLKTLYYDYLDCINIGTVENFCSLRSFISNTPASVY
jgi:hypothetical protein